MRTPVYDKLRKCLRDNKKYLNKDGYIQLDKSPLIAVGLEDYGKRLFAARFKQEMVHADGLQIDNGNGYFKVWISTDNSEIIEGVHACVIEDEYLETIYKELVSTINNKQTPKTKTPMKDYEIQLSALAETRAKMMAKAESAEEQESVRNISDLMKIAILECEIERLLSKFGKKMAVPGNVRAAFIKDKEGNDITILLINELVYIVVGELVDESSLKPFHTFDDESQTALLNWFRSDIKEKLTDAFNTSREQGRFMDTIVYKSALEEEFGDEE